MEKKRLHPVHPGEVLLEEFLKPMGFSQNRVAFNIGVPPRRINESVFQKRRITADTALRLARFFLVLPLSFGLDYRHSTIWMLLLTNLANASNAK